MINSEREKIEVMKQFNEGMNEWREFCNLMDKHPGLSYGALNIIYKLKKMKGSK